MKALRMANAIVHFRVLRSVGRFQPTQKNGVYQFHPCSCGKMRGEPLPNGLPKPMRQVSVRDIVDHYSAELGILCLQHYS